MGLKLRYAYQVLIGLGDGDRLLKFTAIAGVNE